MALSGWIRAPGLPSAPQRCPCGSRLPPLPLGVWGAHFPSENDDAKFDAAYGKEVDRCNVRKMEHGCEHYRRRCNIVVPCCKQVFLCCHCHNEATFHPTQVYLILFLVC